MSTEKSTDKLRLELSKKETTLTYHYCRIGKRIMDVINQEQATIDLVADQIIDLKHHIALEEHLLQCHYCSAFIDEDSIFCKKCGHRIILIKEERNEETN